jgi:hypothetical protein
MMRAVSSVWIYLLVTEPLAWPTKAAMVTSVKPRSLAIRAARLVTQDDAALPAESIRSLHRERKTDLVSVRLPCDEVGPRRPADSVPLDHGFQYVTAWQPLAGPAPSGQGRKPRSGGAMRASLYFCGRPISLWGKRQDDAWLLRAFDDNGVLAVDIEARS